MAGMVYLIAACALYALFNVLLQRELTGHGGLAKAAVVTTGNLAVVWLAFFVTPTQKLQSIESVRLWQWGLVCGIVVCFANILYFQSYSHGVTAVTGTTMFVLVPVFAILFQNLLYSARPSHLDYLAFLFAVAAVICKAVQHEAPHKG